MRKLVHVERELSGRGNDDDAPGLIQPSDAPRIDSALVPVNTDRRAAARDWQGIVFTLVHGTWGEDSEFLREKSSLRMHLSQALAKPLFFEKFLWSGRNSMRARIRAAVELRDHIDFVNRKYPDSGHILLCHSHGGNIALLALQDADTIHSVDGLVTLATPFLNYRLREVGEWGPFIVGALFAAYFVSVAIYGVLIVSPGALGGDRATVSPLVALLLLGLGLPLLVLGLAFFERWVAHARERCERLACPASPVPMLVLRVSGDEAIDSLAAVSTLNQLIARGAELVATVLGGAVFGSVAAVTAPHAIADQAERFRRLWGCLGIAGSAAVLLVLVFLVLPSLLSVSHILLPAFWSLPIALMVVWGLLQLFGGGTGGATLLVAVSATSTPPVSIDSCFVAQEIDVPGEGVASTASGLNHSLIYSLPVTSNTIVRWLAETFQAQEASVNRTLTSSPTSDQLISLQRRV